MAETSGSRKIEMKKAEKVISAIMKLEGSKLLFNEPVDAEKMGLDDYFDVIKQPMDLGTIAQDLASREHYASASEVKDDVDLVWENCLKYNSRDSDEVTREICNEIKQEFEKRWGEAGLGPQIKESHKRPALMKGRALQDDSLLAEKDVPSEFDLIRDEKALPVRAVTDFYFCAFNDSEKLIMMKARNKLGSATLCGTLLDSASFQDPDKGKDLPFIQTGAILDWCHQYGPDGGILVLTKLAWYKLKDPADRYRGIFKPASVRFAICNSAVEAVQEDPDMDVSEAVDRAILTYQSEKLDLKIRSFLTAQLESWVQNHMKENESEDLPESPQRKKRKRSEDGQNAAEGLPNSEKRQKLKLAPSKFTKTLEEGKSPGTQSRFGRQKKAVKKDLPAEKSPANKKISKVQQNRDANEKRGTPPPPSRCQRIPKELVPDAIAVWEFLQDLAGELQIAPLPLWRLEAALCPGPHEPLTYDDSPTDPIPQNSGDLHGKPEGKITTPEKGNDDKEKDIESPKMSQKKRSAKGLKNESGKKKSGKIERPAEAEKSHSKQAKSDKLIPNGVSAPEADGDEEAKSEGNDQTKQKSEPVQNDQGDQAGRRKKKKRGRPKKDEARVSEQKRPAKIVLKLGSHEANGALDKNWKASDRQGSASALVLREIHCALLRPIENVKIIEGSKPPNSVTVILPPNEAEKANLWPDRVVNAIFRSPEPVSQETWDAAILLAHNDYWHLTPSARIAILKTLVDLALNNEAIRQIMQNKAEAVPIILPKSMIPDVSKNSAEVAQAPLGSIEEWETWKSIARKNWRKPLGLDFDKRRYWALGGGSSCWTIFVESPEGDLWGWYEGGQICHLLQWLKSGKIDRENALIKALSSAPLPRSSSTPAKKKTKIDHGQVLQFQAGQDDALKEVATAEELQNKRIDGVRGKVAPFLRGYGHWSDTNSQTTHAESVYQCVEALLGDIPFWFKEGEGLKTRAKFLGRASNASNPAEINQILLEVENILESNGLMSIEWKEKWVDIWKSELGEPCQIQDCLLHVAALQEHVIRKDQNLTRMNLMKVAKEQNCHLKFPFPGEQLIMFKSGILQHIVQYMKALGLAHSNCKPTIENHPESVEDVSNLHAQDTNASNPDSDLKAIDANIAHDLAEEMHLEIGEIKEVNPEEKSVKEEKEKSSLIQQDTSKSDKGGKENVGNPISQNPENLSRASPNVGNEDTISDHPEASKEDDKILEQDTIEKPVNTNLEEKIEEDIGMDATEEKSPEEVEKVGSEEKIETQPVEITLADKLSPEILSALKDQWNDLEQTIKKLKYVETYTVISVAYRRNLLSGSVAENPSPKETESTIEPGTEVITEAERWPVAWLLLKPQSAENKSDENLDDGEENFIALPLRVDLSVPDYTLNVEEYEEKMRVSWTVGQRFQMFFAGKKNQRGKSVGSYYKGRIANIRNIPNEDPTEEEKNLFDPWENIEVEWHPSRALQKGECKYVSPWEIEPDPDDLERIERERRMEESKNLALAHEDPTSLFDSQNHPTRSDSFLQMEGYEGDERRRKTIDEDWNPHDDSPSPSGFPERDWIPVSDTGLIGNQGKQKTNSTQVSQETLDHLRRYSKEEFVMLVSNWYRLNKGKFKIPTFAHKELDIFRVFWEVQGRGGSECVSYNKLWKDVCRSLGVNLSGQTSASFNMRQNYEKCILEFEQYLASGQYLWDVRNKILPSTSSIQHFHEGTQMQPGTGGSGKTRRMGDLLQGSVPIQSFKSGTHMPLNRYKGVPQAEAYRNLAQGLKSWRRMISPSGTASQKSQSAQGWTANCLGISPVAIFEQPLPPSKNPFLDPLTLSERQRNSILARPQIQFGSAPKHVHQFASSSSMPQMQQGQLTGQQNPNPQPFLQDPISAFTRLLESGYSVQELHDLIDQAAGHTNQNTVSSQSFPPNFGSSLNFSQPQNPHISVQTQNPPIHTGSLMDLLKGVQNPSPPRLGRRLEVGHKDSENSLPGFENEIESSEPDQFQDEIRAQINGEESQNIPEISNHYESHPEDNEGLGTPLEGSEIGLNHEDIEMDHENGIPEVAEEIPHDKEDDEHDHIEAPEFQETPDIEAENGLDEKNDYEEDEKQQSHTYSNHDRNIQKEIENNDPAQNVTDKRGISEGLNLFVRDALNEPQEKSIRDSEDTI